MTVETPKENSPGLQLLISPQDLYLDQKDILVNANGAPYTVRFLEKRGDQWVATVDADVRYCPKGHMTCKNCSQCHTEGCWYFVRHCNLWK
jgi:hypothetical protein